MKKEAEHSKNNTDMSQAAFAGNSVPNLAAGSGEQERVSRQEVET